MAVKWLENCSLLFIKEIIASHANIMSSSLLKRLCRKSIKVLEYYVTAKLDEYIISLQNVTFLLKSHTEEFLNITDSLNEWTFKRPIFDKKATQILMENCFERICENFDCYSSRIDMPTFIKYLHKHNINIDFFILSKYKRVCFYELKPFLRELPREKAVSTLRKMYEIQQNDSTVNDECIEVEELFYRLEQNGVFSMVYRWYEFAPFEIALRDLQKFIYAESSAEERHSMLIVLLTNAEKNMELVRRVLQYYHDRHINAPYMHKIGFVNSVLTKHDAFRFDETTWSILNELFHSLEVYIESKNKVQQCLITIILRNILHGQPVHAVVEQKFMFNSLIDMKKKLHQYEQVKLFDYLYHQMLEKLRSVDINREAGMQEAVTLVDNILTLIKDWKKEETHHQVVIDNIIKLSNLNKQLSWDTDMRYLYCSVKPYHKQLFENSLLLYPCEEMCINALKHDPGLLERYKTEVTALCHNNKVWLRIFLSKLRIYWRESLASEWRSTFLNSLQHGNGHKALVRGVIMLSPQCSLLDFIKKYTPTQDKIMWTEGNEIEISIQKHIAKSMHLARPQLPVEVMLWFAKGDYLQFVLFSVNAIYCNLRTRDIQKHIEELLDGPVSLKKNGIRLAFAKMTTVQLLDTFSSIWKSTKNSSIRNMLFQSVFKFLKKEEGTLLIDTWKLLSFMIGDLNYKENTDIYRTLSYYVNDVPLGVIGEYYQKTYLFLKGLPKSWYNEYLFDNVVSDAPKYIQYLNSTFVEEDILKPVNKFFVSKDYSLSRILSAYLLCSKDEATQMQRYKNLIEPLFEIYVPKWKNNYFESNVLDAFEALLKYIATDLPRFVFDMNMVMPVNILAQFLNVFENELSKDELYRVTSHYKLFIAYIKLINEMMIEDADNRNWESFRNNSVEKYSKICSAYLKDDLQSFFPSIHKLFADALKRTCNDFDFGTINLLNLLDAMLICKDEQIYMFVLKALPNVYSWESAENKKLDEIRRKLYSYPSKELKMHYFVRYRHLRYNIEDNKDDIESDLELEHKSKEENTASWA